MTPGLVVEYAGLPGAGKSTLAEETRQALRDSGIACRIGDAGISAAAPRPVRVGRRLALAGRHLVRRPVAGFRSLRRIRAVAPSGLRDGLAGAVQWLAVQELLDRARRTPGVTLLEEGPVQTAWTLALRSRGALPPGRLLEGGAETRADRLVLVEAPVALAAARLAVRPSRHSRTQRLPEGERGAELRKGEDLLVGLVDPVLPLLRVPNDGTAAPRQLGRSTARWLLDVNAR